MDKEKEIEKIKTIMGCDYNDCESCYSYSRKSCSLRPMAERLVDAGYGDVQAAVNKTAQDIFSWIYKNLVNLNFTTGNVEINMQSLQNFAKTYGVELFGISDKLEGNK